MLSQLENTEKRYAELEAALADPELFSKPDLFKDYNKEYKNLTPIILKFREYKLAELKMAESLEWMNDPSLDADLRELAGEEYYESKEALQRIEEELRVLLLPKNPDDDKNVVMEIRGGAGGEEAALFVAVLYRMYSMYAQSAGYKLDVLNANPTELGGYKEISFSLAGEGAYSRFKFEAGVHRVQRVPATESQGRIQTSTATVAVLPEAEDVEVEIKSGDILMESCKSSGAGGQHVNKTESAVRLTHKPTGIVIECQEERSQFKNRDKAMKMLRAKLYRMKQEEQDSRIASSRRTQVGTGDRSERIRTYNYPQNRVTDHRIGLTLYKLDKMLDGNISELLEALAAEDVAKKLQSETEH